MDFKEMDPIKIKGKEKKEIVFIPSFKKTAPHHHPHNHTHQHKPEQHLIGRETELTSILHVVSLFKQYVFPTKNTVSNKKN
jgi:hypothetical protein